MKFSRGNFVGFHRGEQADALQRNHPAAFLLLCLIARRARYTEEPCRITGLRFGEAFIGDWQEAGLRSIQSYRSAKVRLEALHLCNFQGTKTGTNRGTVATLLPQGVFSISATGGTNGGTSQEHLRNISGTSQEPQTTRKPKTKETKQPGNQPKSPPKSPKGDLVNDKVEEIWEAYPKKKGKPSGINAITKALKKVDHNTLLEKTKAYADARKGEADQFTPHPATWFNDERFNDDPSTWKSSSPNSPRPSADRSTTTTAELMAGKQTEIIDLSQNSELELELESESENE